MKNINDKLLIVVIILVLIGIGTFVIFFKYQTNKTGNDKFIKNSKEVIKEDNNKNKLDINSNEIINLYDYIPINYSYLNNGEKNAYQSVKTTKDDIKKEILALTAFKVLEKEFTTGKYTCYVVEDNLSNQSEEIAKNCKEILEEGTWYLFDQKNLTDKTKELYNEIINVKEAKQIGSELQLQGNKYLYSFGGESTGASYKDLRVISNAYIENDSIIIEDLYGTLYEGEDLEKDGKFVSILYSNSERNKKVRDFSNIFNIDVTGEENIIKYNQLNLSKYKHTFKKNNNGNYYWYSTEPIK